MDRYGVMNEEKQPNPDNSSISYIDIVADRVNPPATISLHLKVTDSDIRIVEIVLATETVAGLKLKVRKTQAFAQEMSQNQKIRLIYNGRIMIDSQPLSIYSRFYLEFTDKAYIHAVLSDPVPEDVKQGKKEAIRGFDKLESSGFNVDDIHNLRFHFHAMCIYTGISQEDEDDKVALEEEWLDGKLPQINANLRDRSEILLGIVRDRQDAEDGDGIDFWWGVGVGIIFSVFFFACKNKFGMNHRQKCGVMLGIPLSLMWVVVILKICGVF